MKTKQTQGEWELRISNFKDYIAVDTKGISNSSNRSIIYKSFDPQSNNFNEDYYEEWKANAKLISDAGTTTNKCGFLPSEILAQRDDLLRVLKGMLNTFKEICLLGQSELLDVKRQ